MRYIITETQSDELFPKFLKKINIKYDIMYLNDNGYDSITATVYLYENGEVFGYRHGYEFFFNYDSRFNRLIPNGHYPKIEKVDIFESLPPEMIINFFTGKVETYLKKFIDDGYSTLRRK